eukprot:328862_1
MTTFISFITSLLLFHTVKSLSVCDDVDITFIIDEDTIKHNLDDLVIFIDSIIEHGSSEHSAVSAYIYGSNINYYQEINLLELHLVDTYGRHRKHKSSKMIAHLTDIFKNITLPPTSSNITIGLVDAFVAANKQEQPTRIYKKQYRFQKYLKHEIGREDDHNKYFIFDHFNKLLDVNNPESQDICLLLDYADSERDDSIHFIMGQQLKYLFPSFNTFCGGNPHL